VITARAVPLRRVLAVAVLAALCSCRGADVALPPRLPLVVVAMTDRPDDAVQVTVDPEGTLVTARGGTTVSRALPRAEVDELAHRVASAHLDRVGSSRADGHEVRYLVLSGSTEVGFPASSVPPRVAGVLAWVRGHADLVPQAPTPSPAVP
jgi:hypothetical protein